MSTSVHEFISLFNQLHSHMRRYCDDERADFGAALSQATRKDRSVRANERRLRSLAELRNAIVHQTLDEAEYIAEPTEKTMVWLRQLVDEVLHPGIALDAGARSPRVFGASDMVSDALEHMRENDFSQVIVSTDGTNHGLSSEGITRWITSCIPDEFALTDTPLGSVLAHQQPNAFRFIGRDCTVYDAREAFAAAPALGEARLSALLVTHNGRPNEAILGIVTPWDVIVGSNHD